MVCWEQQRSPDQPGRDLQPGEQGRGAVADVVGSLFLGDPGADRQDRRGPVQGLDLRLVVDADHDCPRGRVQVEPHDVADLGLELGVGTELERLGLPRLQAPAPPGPSHRREADVQLVGKQPGRPVRHPERGWRWLQGDRDDRRLVVDSWTPRPVQIAQRVDAAGALALAPQPDRRLAHSRQPGRSPCCSGPLRPATGSWLAALSPPKSTTPASTPAGPARSRPATPTALLATCPTISDAYLTVTYDTRH